MNAALMPAVKPTQFLKMNDVSVVRVVPLNNALPATPPHVLFSDLRVDIVFFYRVSHRACPRSREFVQHVFSDATESSSQGVVRYLGTEIQRDPTPAIASFSR